MNYENFKNDYKYICEQYKNNSNDQKLVSSRLDRIESKTTISNNIINSFSELNQNMKKKVNNETFFDAIEFINKNISQQNKDNIKQENEIIQLKELINGLNNSEINDNTSCLVCGKIKSPRINRSPRDNIENETI